MTTSFSNLPSIQIFLPVVGTNCPPTVRCIEKLNANPAQHHPADLDAFTRNPHAGSIKLILNWKIFETRLWICGYRRFLGLISPTCLRAAFTRIDPKSKKGQSSHRCLFALSGFLRA